MHNKYTPYTYIYIYIMNKKSILDAVNNLPALINIYIYIYNFFNHYEYIYFFIIIYIYIYKKHILLSS